MASQLKNSIHVIILALSFMITSEAIAQNKDSIRTKSLSVLPVPTFGYSPETRIYAGVVCLFNYRLGNDSDTRSSNSKLEINYTQRKQIITEAGWNIFGNHERFFTSGKISYSKFPDYFWGIGAETADSSRITYSTSRFLAETIFAFKIRKNIYVGPTFRILQYADAKLIAGPSSVFNEVETGKSISVPGVAFIKDTRNNLLLPSKGMYFSAQYQFHISKIKAYHRFLIDARKYKIWQKNIFSIRFKSLYSAGPAYDLALLGGDENARGYYSGRYRDNISTTIQTEVKRTLYKRWGLAIFGGVSAVNGKSEAIFLKPNGGAGIRFLIDRKENINLRIDYAIGTNGNSGFYIAFGESF